MSATSPLVVLPNRNTLGLGAVLAAMWYAGAGQSNGAAYLLCFTLAALAAVSVAHAWANLRGAKLTVDPITSVFAGESLSFLVRAEAKSGRRHVGLVVSTGRGAKTSIPGEVTATSPAQAVISQDAPRRGAFKKLEIRLSSVFPLGFFTARRLYRLNQAYFVYPKPAGDLPLPVSPTSSREAEMAAQIEGDDFAGVRAWQAGESMRHVDWKAVARGHRLLVKQWRGGAGAILTLDWDDLAALDTEARLSQLTRWTILAEHNEMTYGLRVPGTDIEPARGEAHFHTCLRILASYPAGEPVSAKFKTLSAHD